MLTTSDLQLYLNQISSLVREAGSRLIESSLDTDIWDPLTNPSIRQDKETERFILDFLHQHFPEHGCLGEEFGWENQQAEYIRIIDPIDGTNNYVEGRDTFSISLGLAYQGEIILWVVYLPKRDELFSAIKGEGAYLNGERISVGNCQSPEQAIVTYSTAPGHEHETAFLDEKVIAAFPKLKFFAFTAGKQVDSTFGRGAMAAEFCYLACGRIDALMRFRQKAWDVAWGCLIAQEAGAKMNNLDENPCNVYEGDYIAANPTLLQKINKILHRV